jgi:hypothetical protein
MGQDGRCGVKGLRGGGEGSRAQVGLGFWGVMLPALPLSAGARGQRGVQRHRGGRAGAGGPCPLRRRQLCAAAWGSGGGAPVGARPAACRPGPRAGSLTQRGHHEGRGDDHEDDLGALHGFGHVAGRPERLGALEARQEQRVLMLAVDRLHHLRRQGSRLGRAGGRADCWLAGWLAGWLPAAAPVSGRADPGAPTSASRAHMQVSWPFCAHRLACGPGVGGGGAIVEERIGLTGVYHFLHQGGLVLVVCASSTHQRSAPCSTADDADLVDPGQ